MSSRASIVVFFVLLMLSSARAEDEPAPGESPESPAKPPEAGEAVVPPKEKPKQKPKGEEPEEKPYKEGWHAGSPPGEHVVLRYDFWRPDTGRGAEFEFGKGRVRVGVITTKALDYPSRETVPGGGVEVYTGKTGWLSFDYWQLELSGRVTRFTVPHALNHVLFAQGDVVTGVVSQHYVKLRDGYDVRYRFPLGDDTSLDIMFAPVTSLMIRQESIDVRSVVAFRRAGGQFTSISLVPGLRIGVDLHLPLKFTLSVGGDFDWLPELPHAPFSFTDPRVTKWEDARGFVGVRWFFLEASFGYRHWKALSQGPTVRTASARMDGIDVVVAARF